MVFHDYDFHIQYLPAGGGKCFFLSENLGLGLKSFCERLQQIRKTKLSFVTVLKCCFMKQHVFKMNPKVVLVVLQDLKQILTKF
jgi:hypothetical protein